MARAKPERRTGASPAFARAVAARLPGVETQTRRGVTTFSVDGAVFLAVDDDLADDTADVDGVAVLCGAVGRDDLRARIESAWLAHAPRPRAAQFKRARAQRDKQPALTHAEVRAMILALPGAVEGPIWGAHLGFLIGDVKRTRFARFGPPEGQPISRLAAPDDVDTLVVLECEQRPELLAAGADRFFTTPHYGDPGEPGGVITRLAEHRTPAEKAEVAELLEDAWRTMAPPELVEQWECQRRPRC